MYGVDAVRFWVVRIVQLGQGAAPAATLPSAAIRGKQLELYGFSDFAVPADVLAEHYRRLVRHVLAAISVT